MLFDVGRSTVAGRAALTVRGELDLATAPQLADAAAALMQSSPEGFVIDLSPTKFLDSSGARTLMVIARDARAAGVPLHVLVPRTNRPVRLPIDLLDLGTAVPLVAAASEIGSSVAHKDAGT
ncbi:STAS domain-containing protein [Blastococcus sp. LR1]|uniref:STAS domain-containing protein n=1 Tax=Blastococcus sp. LR1 TaxID=2877000 RepID=UPI001CCB00D7|nr:STAS domain-containing protein [Blastococcus sp. LR1]MCA0146785.1 STAS domain-containing protein [Blastococcus sp. LR1]